MASEILLEVCLDSVASAIAAEQGGARRVEVCSNLAEGGVTPSAGLIAMVRKRITIGMHVLIRPRSGDFCYSAAEFEVMKREIVLAKQLGANGVALGVLDAQGRADVPRTRELAELARPLSVTFNRAFDVTPDLAAALEDVMRSGADRVLTSGGKATAIEGLDVIAQLVSQSAGRVGILACGTVRAENVAEVVEKTGVREVHARLDSAVSDRGDRGALVRVETVIQLLRAVGNIRA